MLLVKSFDFLQGKQPSMVLLGLGYWMCPVSEQWGCASRVGFSQFTAQSLERNREQNSREKLPLHPSHLVPPNLDFLLFRVSFFNTVHLQEGDVQFGRAENPSSTQSAAWFVGRCSPEKNKIFPKCSKGRDVMHKEGIIIISPYSCALMWKWLWLLFFLPLPASPSGSLWCSCTAKDWASCFSLQLELTRQTCPSGNNFFFFSRMPFLFA